MTAVLREMKGFDWTRWLQLVRGAKRREIQALARAWRDIHGEGLLATLQLIRESWRPELRVLAPEVPVWIQDALWKAETWHERLGVLVAAAGSAMPEENWPAVMVIFRLGVSTEPVDEQVLRHTTEFLILAAVANHASEALEAIAGSPITAALEPAAVALR